MTSTRPVLTALASWKALEAHYAQVRDKSLRSLFAEDETRGERLRLEAAGVYLDYS